MKIVIGVVSLFLVVAVVFLGGLVLVRESGKGYMFPVVFGRPSGDTIQFQLGIPKHIIKDDPPGKNLRGVLLWSKWRQERFKLLDGAGNDVRLRKTGYSPLMDELKGDFDMVLYADVKTGDPYTCSYLRYGEETEQYQYSFTAPGERHGGGCLFKPVKD